MIAAAALLAAPAAIGVPPPVTIPVLRAHLHQWNGRQVAVRGWAHGCDWSLTGFCYISPAPRWRKGHGRLELVPGPRVASGLGRMPVGEVLVLGRVEEEVCPADAVCFDGEDHLRVDSVEPVRRSRS